MGESEQATPATEGSSSSNRENDTGLGHPSAFFAPGASSWTKVIPRTEHNALFLDCDYGSTTLGPIQDWGPALRLYASMVFVDSRGACVYWGPDRIAFYNKKFAASAGEAHPFLMGKSFKAGFPAIVEQISPVFDHAAATAQTIDVENILLFPVRHGFPEETYFTGQFIPLRGDSGEIEGFYNTVYEETVRILWERRRLIVDRIAAIPPLPVDETLSMIIEALQGNPNDITMALLYSYDELAPRGASNLRLRGSIGVHNGHPCAPTESNLETSDAGLVPLFRQVKQSAKPLVLSDTDGSLQKFRHLFDEVSWCGYGEPARDIIILPLSISGNMLGFYAQGTNPRRAYDEATERSIIDVTRQMEAKWVSSMSSEQARLREEALERRATDSENRLRHMAQSAPLGMCQIDLDQKIQWANDQFWEITGHDRAKPDVAALVESLAPEEREDGLEILGTLLHGASRVVREVRLSRRWSPPIQKGEAAEETSAWMLTIGFPLMENGKVKLIMGYVTDISYQKWSESVQKRNAAAAILAKHQQEEFIDTTSHEMRNPLSAITQLADGIARSLQGNHADTADVYRTIAHDNVEAANTILACAAHQKRVIDDVLILSRLESQMLSITPVVERASKVVGDTVKMFDGEVALNGTDVEAVRDNSYDNLHADYVYMDTSRLTQVLINLISNAIKFTASQTIRKISVVYGAKAERPPRIRTIFGDLNWVDPTDPERLNTALPPLEAGQKRLYLYFYVQDTGTGLTSEEMQKLFKRFSQATSRTHIAYGGSGLGLYICRELAEKQGGGVGVASKRGEGSVFGFYIETRPAAAPEQAHDRHHPPLDEPAVMVNGRPSLPRRFSSKTEVITMGSSPRSSNRTPQSPTSPVHLPQQDFRILLVEDNLVNQRVLAKQLRMAKCAVTVANHGEEALKMLEKADCWQHSRSDPAAVGNGDFPNSPLRIDVVLMDLEMPVMNGLECCKRIRLLERKGQITRRLPVIATTANVRQEQKDEAIAAGMDDVVSKPFTVKELLDRMSEIIETT